MLPMGSMLPVPVDKVAVSTKTGYCGNVIYENGTLGRILVDGGYITVNITKFIYHYYIHDHLGNNRLVFNQNGTIEQEITNRNKGSINPDLYRKPKPE